MDEQVLHPGESVTFYPVTSYSIRVTGPGLDISLGIASWADIEIIEKLLVKLRSAISAGAKHGD